MNHCQMIICITVVRLFFLFFSMPIQQDVIKSYLGLFCVAVTISWAVGMTCNMRRPKILFFLINLLNYNSEGVKKTETMHRTTSFTPKKSELHCIGTSISSVKAELLIGTAFMSTGRQVRAWFEESIVLLSWTSSLFLVGVLLKPDQITRCLSFILPVLKML